MKALILSTAALATLALSSCNTFVGIGRDFKSLGQGVENKAYGNTWKGEPRAQKSKQNASGQQQAVVPQTTVPQP
jgi:predicted small secreted protein